MDMTDQRMCDNCKCNCYDCCDPTLINIRCPDHSLALDKCSFPQVFVLPQCHGALSPKSSRFNCFQCSNIFKGFFSQLSQMQTYTYSLMHRPYSSHYRNKTRPSHFVCVSNSYLWNSVTQMSHFTCHQFASFQFICFT